MPERNANGYRRYSGRDLEWVEFILRLKRMDVPLIQIKEYARLRHMGDSTIPERYEILLAHYENLVRKQQELEEHQALLAQKLSLYRSAMQKPLNNSPLQQKKPSPAKK